MVHQSSTLDRPRHVFASVYQIVFPQGFVRRLHSFFYSIVRFTLPIQSISLDLERVLEGQFEASRCGVTRYVAPLFKIPDFPVNVLTMICMPPTHHSTKFDMSFAQHCATLALQNTTAEFHAAESNFTRFRASGANGVRPSLNE